MILVTGGSGLTGQFVVEELQRRGHAVRILCRAQSADLARATGAEVALGDLSDPQSVERATRGVRGIVHAACTFTDSAVDLAAMAALLSGWRDGPLVYISSLDVYGLVGGPLAGPITEDTPLSLTYNDYSRGKVACEQLLVEAAGRAGRSDYVLLRAPYIWGPHPTARRRLLPKRLQEHQPLVLPGVSEAERAQYQDVWIDARDLATIVAECLVRPAGGPLNVLTGHFTWDTLYRELIRLLGSRSPILYKPLAEITDEELPNKQLYAQRWRFSEQRLAQHLGTIPRLPLDVTLRDTILLQPHAPR